MRFEGKNKIFKAAARKSNFKNIAKSLAEHHQWLQSMQLAEIFAKGSVCLAKPVSISVTELHPDVQAHVLPLSYTSLFK